MESKIVFYLLPFTFVCVIITAREWLMFNQFMKYISFKLGNIHLKKQRKLLINGYKPLKSYYCKKKFAYSSLREYKQQGIDVRLVKINSREYKLFAKNL
jgi:hypothetical protein